MNLTMISLLDKHIKEAHKIYNYYIENSYSNFEEKKISLKDFTLSFKKISQKKLPYLAAISDSKIVGIAYLNKFREKSGYRFTHEHSIYVHPNYLNNGYGSIILNELIIQCKKNKNIKNLIAVIGSSDNDASIKIHKKYGFKLIGTIIKAGYKKNKWIDSVYMQKRL